MSFDNRSDIGSFEPSFVAQVRGYGRRRLLQLPRNNGLLPVTCSGVVFSAAGVMGTDFKHDQIRALLTLYLCWQFRIQFTSAFLFFPVKRN